MNYQQQNRSIPISICIKTNLKEKEIYKLNLRELLEENETFQLCRQAYALYSLKSIGIRIQPNENLDVGKAVYGIAFSSDEDLADIDSFKKYKTRMFAKTDEEIHVCYETKLISKLPTKEDLPMKLENVFAGVYFGIIEVWISITYNLFFL